jgi:hypothetical protein
VNVYETAISVLTATPGTAEDNQDRREAVGSAGENPYPWWQRALRSPAGRKVLAKLAIAATLEGILPAEWEAHPLVEPNDRRCEAALPVTALALRAALHARAGVMFLERRGVQAGHKRGRSELHLCAIDPEGTRAALMAVC